MRGNPYWRENLSVGDTVIAGEDDKACKVISIDGDTVTLEDDDGNQFTSSIQDLK